MSKILPVIVGFIVSLILALVLPLTGMDEFLVGWFSCTAYFGVYFVSTVCNK